MPHAGLVRAFWAVPLCIREVGGDRVKRELGEERGGRLALQEKAERLPHHPFDVVFGGPQLPDEALRHGDAVPGLAVALADPDLELARARVGSRKVR
jgi:hypothetical protein